MPRSPAGSPERLFSLLLRITLALAIVCTAVKAWGFARQALALRTPLPGGEPPRDGCTIWFVGSSTINRWPDLGRAMAPWSVRQRGVNGVHIDEIERRLLNDPPGPPPAAIVNYAGENDIADGASAPVATASMMALVDIERRRMPGVPIVVIAQKPSPTRWFMRGAQLEDDRLVAQALAKRPGTAFVPAGAQLLVDGAPGPYYREDGIHLDERGYAVWGAAVRSGIERALPAALVHRCLAAARR
jgi:lysophospholipase L1-like esterase